MKKIDIAVVGATGMVGTKMLEVLKERKLPVNNYYLFASARSAGKVVPFMGKDYTVIELSAENIKKYPVQIALFSAGASTSKTFAPLFAEHGAVVVDNSSQWRTDPKVPLVVPEVNPDDIKWHKGIIANPNCSTIQAVVALKPLHDEFDIKRIVYATYQSVSGAGQAGYLDLENGIKHEPPKKFPRPIFGNVIPQIDVFTDNGYTKEEQKMMFETRKILNNYDIKITATTVRVPVFYGHSEAINVEFHKPVNLERARKVLSKAKGVVLMDDPEKGVYPTALDCVDKDEVFVGRLRLDNSVESGIDMWVVADNIRKGAATNAVQIAELVIKSFK